MAKRYKVSNKRSYGCLDACCRPAREPAEFDAEQGGMSEADVAELVKLSAAGVLTVVLFQLLFKLLWELALIVPGFALFDGAPSTFSAYTHGGWWMNIDTIALFVGATSVYFGLNYSSDAGVLERNVDRTVSWLGAYMVVLAFAALGDLVHGSFSLSELTVCDSTLCRDNQWLLIVLVVALFLRTALMLWGVYRVWVYRTNLKYAVAMNRMDLALTETAKAPPAPTAAPISTPLLAKTRAARLGVVKK